MNYDLFIPASAISGPSGSVVSAAQIFGGRQRSAATEAAKPPVDGQAALRPPQGSASEQLSTQEVKNTVVAFNEVFAQANVSVRYRIDENTDDLVISMVNRDTDEVLRQIPPDQILKMRQRLEELMGLIFDSTV
jgi:flagellar protein FlaG